MVQGMTPEEVKAAKKLRDKMVRYYRQGLTYQQIAAKVNRTKEWVNMVLIEERKKGTIGTREPGETQDNWERVKEAKRIREKIKEMRLKGETAEATAKEVERSAPYVRSILAEMVRSGEIEPKRKAKANA